MPNYYVNKPGDLDPPKRKSPRSYFAFFVNTNDILNELGKFNKALGQDLKSHMEASNPARTIQKNISRHLGSMASTRSKRIQTILNSMSKGRKYTTFDSKPAKHTGVSKSLRMQMINIKIMDKETNIGRLDKLYPQKHKAEFAGNPVKKLKGKAKAYRKQEKFSLWRMYEYVTSGAYKIPQKAKGPLLFTASNDGYSSWIVSRQVQFLATGRGPSSSAYYMLNESRRMYKSDKEVFSKAVSRGIKRVIETKTRFK
jgi:hypothetical protein